MLADSRSSEPHRTHHKTNSNSADSVSTQESNSPREDVLPRIRRHNKEKLELCRTFSEMGYCPYERKCKFAHGYHELRRNNVYNMKYKTKECFTFIKNGFCNYGSRCNFIHRDPEESAWKLGQSARSGFRDIFYSVGFQSRLTVTKLPEQ